MLPNNKDVVYTLQTLSDQAILVTLDVTSLYTNIPITEGIEALSKAIQNSKRAHAAEVYITLLNLVLALNYFEFDSTNYLQIFGTSMGNPFAPTYANIFMGQLEAQLLESSPLKPRTYLRYIDDIFIIWEHGESALSTFVEHFNNFHPSIKFSMHHSPSKIDFLDTTVTIENGKLKTTLYRKPTDSQQYLDYNSHHPRHCKQGIYIGQARRIRRICSNDADYVHHLSNLMATLAERNHPHDALNKAYNDARKLDRTQALEKRTPKAQANQPLAFITKYSNALPNINNILRKYYPILTSNDRLRKAFPEIPRVTYRRNRNFKDLLVHAKVNPQRNACVITCSRPRCKTCKHIQIDLKVKSTGSDYVHHVKSSFTCTSSNVIYMLECSLCHKQYIGETGQPINVRLNGHRADTANNLPKAVAQHFNMTGHNFDELKLYILQGNFRSAKDRKYRESYLIYRFQTLQPTGINLSKGTLESIRYSGGLTKTTKG